MRILPLVLRETQRSIATILAEHDRSSMNLDRSARIRARYALLSRNRFQDSGLDHDSKLALHLSVGNGSPNNIHAWPESIALTQSHVRSDTSVTATTHLRDSKLPARARTLPSTHSRRTTCFIHLQWRLDLCIRCDQPLLACSIRQACESAKPRGAVARI